MSSISSASREVMMRGLPRSNALGIADFDPTAMIAWANRMNCWPCTVSTRKEPHKVLNYTWLLSPQRLISGMSYVGQWEKRLLAILKEAEKKEHILYFDDFLALYYAGRTSQSAGTLDQVKLNGLFVVSPSLLNPSKNSTKATVPSLSEAAV